MTRRPNLLLCFDAFGTLFKPKRHVALQYADVARQCGLAPFSDDELKSAFSTAFKREARSNPNYGKKAGLGATQWWTNVINNTFAPFLAANESMPPELAPRLLHRFSSSEAYTTEPNLVSSLRRLRETGTSKHLRRIIVGVITNSDDRVPDVLSSFGLRVSPLRYGVSHAQVSEAGQYDIDFHCMSYDVGHEKPDPRIFTAAEEMLDKVLQTPAVSGGNSLEHEWLKIYVGDEYDKDVMGATNAGWKAVLLDTVLSPPHIPKLEDYKDLSVSDATRTHATLKVQSIHNLTTWLAAQA